ncbi:MAG: DUF4870 domain-containing protein [Methylacidiphilales bacterium]|nr:DUF4870 domain-containing protein [Candidatus Methylacidiphilales bacterium]MDW8350156.1 DUF4870 domain-containing protein [Verrucomicrobiae bacterium]
MEASIKVDGTEKLISYIVHLSPLIGLPVLIPALVWIAKKGENSLSSMNAASALNFQILMLILSGIAWILTLVLIGFLIFPVLVLWAALQMVFACIATYRGKPHRYFPALPIFRG